MRPREARLRKVLAKRWDRDVERQVIPTRCELTQKTDPSPCVCMEISSPRTVSRLDTCPGRMYLGDISDGRSMEPGMELREDDKRELLRFARGVVEAELSGKKAPELSH